MNHVRKILPTRSVCDFQTPESICAVVTLRVLDRRRYSSYFSRRSRGRYANSRQRGMIVTLTVALLLSIGLLLLLGPFEMARATWLLSQSY